MHDVKGNATRSTGMTFQYIWAVMHHRVYHRQIHSVVELKRQLIDVWYGLNSRFLTKLLTSGEEDIERVSVPNGDTSSTACELTMWILSSCYIQCDFFDCYIFNYEIMPATLANTFLFILQGSALTDLRYGGRFYDTVCCS